MHKVHIFWLRGFRPHSSRELQIFNLLYQNFRVRPHVDVRLFMIKFLILHITCKILSKFNNLKIDKFFEEKLKNPGIFSENAGHLPRRDRHFSKPPEKKIFQNGPDRKLLIDYCDKKNSFILPYQIPRLHF